MLLADGKTRASVDAMRKAAKHLGVAAPKQRGAKPDGELLAAIRIEVNKRLESISEDDHVQCLQCGEVATDDVPFCPFCGDEGNVVSEEMAQATAALSGEKLDPTADDEPDDEPGDEDEESESDDEEESDKEENDEEEAEEEEDAAEASVGIAAAKAPVANVDAAIAKLGKDLDARIDNINKMRKSAVALTYDIGLELKAIRDQQLFKARGYGSFRAFAEKELPFTRESALELIRIVDKHGREEYEQIGYSKMRLIASEADTEVKAELIEAAKKGATTRDLRELAAEKAPASAKPAKTKAVAPDKDKGERITLLGKINARKQVVQFHNSETGEVIANAGVFTKKSFVPSAYGELEVSDGVFLRIGLRVGANQELTGFTVRFVRPADES